MASNKLRPPAVNQQPSVGLSMTYISSKKDSEDRSSAQHLDNDAEPLSGSDDTVVDDEKQKDVEGDINKVALTSFQAEYPRAARLFFILLALALSIFLVSIDMTIIATAIPRITDEFHSLDDVGWYGTAFFLTLAR